MRRATRLLAVGVGAIVSSLAASGALAFDQDALQCRATVCIELRRPTTTTQIAEVFSTLEDESRSGRSSADSSANDGLPISAAKLSMLISTCAPKTPSNLMHSLVQTESGGVVWRLATNGGVRRSVSPRSIETARDDLTRLLAENDSVDIGLMQLNSKTLARLHVSPFAALDPCRNLKLGAQIFEAAYARAYVRRSPTAPLWSASSIYNTGDPLRGVRNGYADHVQAQLRRTRTTAG